MCLCVCVSEIRRQRPQNFLLNVTQQGICRCFFANWSNTHSLLCVSDRGMMKGKRKRSEERGNEKAWGLKETAGREIERR